MSRLGQSLVAIVIWGIASMVGLGFGNKMVLAADLSISSFEKSTRSPNATGEASIRLEDFAAKDFEHELYCLDRRLSLLRQDLRWSLLFECRNSMSII